jgi:hypothetical protein
MVCRRGHLVFILRGSQQRFSLFLPPPFALPVFGQALPAQQFKYCGDAALIGSSDSRRIDVESLPSDLANRDLALVLKVGGNGFFPGVAFRSAPLARP